MRDTDRARDDFYKTQELFPLAHCLPFPVFRHSWYVHDICLCNLSNDIINILLRTLRNACDKET